MFKEFHPNDEKLQKKVLTNIRHARFFFFLGVWVAFIMLLFLFAFLTTFLLKNLSFVGSNFVISIWDILKVYGVLTMIFLINRLSPLR